MIGGISGVTADVVPYSTVVGNRAKLSGLNILGLKRRNIKKKEISELRKVYRYIFHNSKDTLRDRVIYMKKKKFKEQTIQVFLDFLSEDSDRSFTLP